LNISKSADFDSAQDFKVQGTLTAFRNKKFLRYQKNTLA